jgi:hypothetical protein
VYQKSSFLKNIGFASIIIGLMPDPAFRKAAVWRCPDVKLHERVLIKGTLQFDGIERMKHMTHAISSTIPII